MSLGAYYRSLLTLEPSSGGTYVAPPGLAKHVNFRNLLNPTIQTPTVTPQPEEVRPTGDGVFCDVSTLNGWNNAMWNVKPGDVIRIKKTIYHPITARFDKYGIAGANMRQQGTAENPITIICMPGVWIDPKNINNNTGAFDLVNVENVNLIGVRVRNSQFGIRLMNVEGASNSQPVRVAHCKAEYLGHSGIAVGGWFQPITSSGGTPTGNDGDEWGFSKYILLEGNTVNRTGTAVGATSYGEAYYLGHGGIPGWIGRAEEVTLRYNTGSFFTADGVDIKPGCNRVRVLDNLFFAAAAHNGAMINALYIGLGIDDKPAWADADPEIYIEGNRCYDLNISLVEVPTSSQLMYLGHSGVRTANNLFWRYPSGSTPFNPAIVLRIEKPEAQFGTYPTWLLNNLYWGRGFENRGHGNPLVGAITLGSWFTDLNNITPVGYGGGQHTAAVAGTDFEGDIFADVNYVDSIEWGLNGIGSGFDLKAASGLVAAGTAFTSADLWYDEDISQRDIPGVSPNPGPFQPFV